MHKPTKTRSSERLTDREALHKEFTEIAELLSERLGVPVEIRDRGITIHVRKANTQTK